MKKEAFLRLQYLRMMNSEEFVIEQWRSSVDRFIADLWDRTPTNAASRFLSPIDPELGYAPDNVEWQFPKVRSKHGRRMPSSKITSPNAPVDKSLSKPERHALRRAEQESAKLARRTALAEEFSRWELSRRSRG